MTAVALAGCDPHEVAQSHPCAAQVAAHGKTSELAKVGLTAGELKLEEKCK